MNDDQSKQSQGERKSANSWQFPNDGDAESNRTSVKSEQWCVVSARNEDTEQTRQDRGTIRVTTPEDLHNLLGILLLHTDGARQIKLPGLTLDLSKLAAGEEAREKEITIQNVDDGGQKLPEDETAVTQALSSKEVRDRFLSNIVQKFDENSEKTMDIASNDRNSLTDQIAQAQAKAEANQVDLESSESSEEGAENDLEQTKVELGNDQIKFPNDYMAAKESEETSKKIPELEVAENIEKKLIDAEAQTEVVLIESPELMRTVSTNLARDFSDFSKALHFTFLGASPRYLEIGHVYSSESSEIDHRGEWEHLEKSLQQLPYQINYRRSMASVENLRQAIEAGSTCIHISCHGERWVNIFKDKKKNLDFISWKYVNHGDFLLFEDEHGMSHPLWEKDLKEMLKKVEEKNKRLNRKLGVELVFIAACHSENLGKAFLQAGVKHVICAKEKDMLECNAQRIFTKEFYMRLFNGQHVCDTYYDVLDILKRHKDESIKRFWHNYVLLRPCDEGIMSTSMQKFYERVKKPGNASLCQCWYIGLWDKGIATDIDSKPPFEIQPPIIKMHQRRKEMHDVSRLLRDKRLVMVHAIPKMGKRTLTHELAFEIQERRRFKLGVMQVSVSEQEPCLAKAILKKIMTASHRGSDTYMKLVNKVKALKRVSNLQQLNKDTECLEDCLRDLQFDVLIVLEVDEDLKQKEKIQQVKDQIRRILDHSKHVVFLVHCDRPFAQTKLGIRKEETYPLEKLDDLRTVEMFFELTRDTFIRKEGSMNEVYRKLAEMNEQGGHAKIVLGDHLKEQDKFERLSKHYFFTQVLCGHPLVIKAVANLVDSFESLPQLCRELSQRPKAHPMYIAMCSSLDKLRKDHCNQPLYLYVLICLMSDGLSEVDFNEIRKHTDQFESNFSFPMQVNELETRCLVKKIVAPMHEGYKHHPNCREKFLRQTFSVQPSTKHMIVAQARLFNAACLHFRSIVLKRFQQLGQPLKRSNSMEGIEFELLDLHKPNIIGLLRMSADIDYRLADCDAEDGKEHGQMADMFEEVSNVNDFDNQSQPFDDLSEAQSAEQFRFGSIKCIPQLQGDGIKDQLVALDNQLLTSANNSKKEQGKSIADLHLSEDDDDRMSIADERNQMPPATRLTFNGPPTLKPMPMVKASSNVPKSNIIDFERVDDASSENSLKFVFGKNASPRSRKAGQSRGSQNQEELLSCAPTAKFGAQRSKSSLQKKRSAIMDDPSEFKKAIRRIDCKHGSSLYAQMDVNKRSSEPVAKRDCGFTAFLLYLFPVHADLLLFYANDLIILKQYEQAMQILQSHLIDFPNPRSSIDEALSANVKKLLALAMWKAGLAFTEPIEAKDTEFSIKSLLKESKTTFQRLGIAHGVAVCAYFDGVVRSDQYNHQQVETDWDKQKQYKDLQKAWKHLRLAEANFELVNHPQGQIVALREGLQVARKIKQIGEGETDQIHLRDLEMNKKINKLQQLRRCRGSIKGAAYYSNLDKCSPVIEISFVGVEKQVYEGCLREVDQKPWDDLNVAKIFTSKTFKEKQNKKKKTQSDYRQSISDFLPTLQKDPRKVVEAKNKSPNRESKQSDRCSFERASANEVSESAGYSGFMGDEELSVYSRPTFPRFGNDCQSTGPEPSAEEIQAQLQSPMPNLCESNGPEQRLEVTKGVSNIKSGTSKNHFARINNKALRPVPKMVHVNQDQSITEGQAELVNQFLRHQNLIGSDAALKDFQDEVMIKYLRNEDIQYEYGISKPLQIVGANDEELKQSDQEESKDDKLRRQFAPPLSEVQEYDESEETFSSMSRKYSHVQNSDIKHPTLKMSKHNNESSLSGKSIAKLGKHSSSIAAENSEEMTPQLLTSKSQVEGPAKDKGQRAKMTKKKKQQLYRKKAATQKYEDSFNQESSPTPSEQ